MGRSTTHKGLQNKESGSAMLEFAILAPLLLAFCLSTYDVGQALTHHLAATQIAREGVRKAIATPGLETGLYTVTESGGAPVCRYRAAVAATLQLCPATSIQGKLAMRLYWAQRKLEENEKLQIAPNSRRVEIEYAFNPALPANNIKVRIGFQYRGLSGIFYSTPVSAVLTSTYL